MSTVSSQQEFSEQLAEFQSSSDKDIMLIVSACHTLSYALNVYCMLLLLWYITLP